MRNLQGSLDRFEFRIYSFVNIAIFFTQKINLHANIFPVMQELVEKIFYPRYKVS